MRDERSPRMVTLKQLQTAILPTFALFVVASTVGCSALKSAPATPLAADTETAMIDDPLVVVELRDGNSDREYLRAPLKESMLVQDALKGSGAVRRFKRMDVVLVRRVSNGQKLRLPIRYNSSQRRVADENNYALHPGDWLEVTENTSNTFDRMIETAMEPLKPVMRTYRD